MSKFMRPPESWAAAGAGPSLSGRTGRGRRRRAELLEPLADQAGARIVGRELQELLVGGDRRRRVVGRLGRLGQLELEAGIGGRGLRQGLIRGRRLAVSRLHLRV